MVRDAIVLCFEQAHDHVTNESLNPVLKDFWSEGVKKPTKSNVEAIVRRAFRKSGGDFNVPDKASIIEAMDWLTEFSKKFREPDVITKHYN